jgi:thioredoxin 1
MSVRFGALGLGNVRPFDRLRAGPGRPKPATPTSMGETMATENVQTFTDGNFDETVLKSSGPVLVDFWAEWCGPCRRIAPTVDALATEYAGKVTVGKLNVDDNPNTGMKFQVLSIPTLLIFKGGQVVESIVGAAQKDVLKKAIDKHL